MKILVTGGAGYIGSHTCKVLAERGHEPVVYDNLSTGHRHLVQFGPLIHGDIGDATAIRKALGDVQPDAVIHFAASAYVGESMKYPRAYYRNNVVGTLTLLDAMYEFGVRKLVFSSSCATYGVPTVTPIREDAVQAPINPYGHTKLVCEQMMRAMAASEQLDCVALRYFNAAGADPDVRIGEHHEPETHAIPLILAAALGRDQFTVMGTDYATPDGSCIRDYLHVLDLARAHLLAVEHLTGNSGFDAINLGTGNGLSVLELVAAAERVTGKAVNPRMAGRRPGDPPALVADASKANESLGWSPTHSHIDTIISTAWNWMNSPFSAGLRIGFFASRTP